MLSIRKSLLLSICRFRCELLRPGYRKDSHWEFSVGMSLDDTTHFCFWGSANSLGADFFMGVVLLQCPSLFPLSSLAFRLGKELRKRTIGGDRKLCWWYEERVKSVHKGLWSHIRVGVGDLTLDCWWENIRLFCVLKLALQFSLGEIMCGREEDPFYIFLV